MAPFASMASFAVCSILFVLQSCQTVPVDPVPPVFCNRVLGAAQTFAPNPSSHPATHFHQTLMEAAPLRSKPEGRTCGLRLRPPPRHTRRPRPQVAHVRRYGADACAVGIYGVLSRSVSRRTKQIGVRVALGARSSVVRHDRERLDAPVMWGALAGIAGALALSRVLCGVVYGLAVTDPLSFGSATALLIVVALVSSWIPARRASRVDPVIACARNDDQLRYSRASASLLTRFSATFVRT